MGWTYAKITNSFTSRYPRQIQDTQVWDVRGQGRYELTFFWGFLREGQRKRYVLYKNRVFTIPILGRVEIDDGVQVGYDVSLGSDMFLFFGREI